MDAELTPEQKRAERIAAARSALQAAYDANPEQVAQFNSRMAKLKAAAKRERERFELLVLEGKRPAPVLTHVRVRGKRRAIKTPVVLEPEIERVVAQREVCRTAATPETDAAYIRAHVGSLADLRQRGTIDAAQLAYAEQIRSAAEAASSDVAMGGVSYEPRIDASATGPADRLIEGLSAARLSVAYGFWRGRLAQPRGAILDMLVGQPVGYTVVAKRYRMDHRKAKKLLIDALDAWPACMDEAVALVTRTSLTEAHARLYD